MNGEISSCQLFKCGISVEIIFSLICQASIQDRRQKCIFGAEIYYMREKENKKRDSWMAGLISREFRRRMSICGMI